VRCSAMVRCSTYLGGLEAEMSTMVAERAQEQLRVSGTELDQERKNSLLRFADLIDSFSVDQHDEETFAKVVEHAISFHGLSMNELADAFGVNKGTVSRWRTGKNAPQPFARPVVLNWIRDWAKSQAARI
jgi:ribosome-binding protein aMBF1 (putative translation factor)